MVPENNTTQIQLDMSATFTEDIAFVTADQLAELSDWQEAGQVAGAIDTLLAIARNGVNSNDADTYRRALIGIEELIQKRAKPLATDLAERMAQQ